MTPQFVDTYYLLALVNSKDKDHDLAVRLSQGAAKGLITTGWVLVEFADALCAVESRDHAARFVRGFQAESYVEIVPPSREQFDRALDLYGRRADKDWSLTDCLSFLVMEEREIRDALTADHHFEQAVFSSFDASAAQLINCALAPSSTGRSGKRDANSRPHFVFDYL